MPDAIPLDLRTARRVAVACQHLAGPRPTADLDGLRTVLRSLRCLQLDPVNAVAPSHLLVLRSRLGSFRRADLDVLLREERWLFEYWAHAASVVLTEDFPVHGATMRHYPIGLSAYGRKVAAWLEANEVLRRHVLDRLRESGPTPVAGFDDLAAVPWDSSGWTSGRNVERMLETLWFQGLVTVAGRNGRIRSWDLTENWLPDAVAMPTLTDTEAVRTAAEHALRALGVARPADINRHFTRDRYPGLGSVLRDLEDAGVVLRVVPDGFGAPGEDWYVHRDRLPVLAEVASDRWEPRTVLLSPFDNLICDRHRTQVLWDFAFRNEMYLPKARRQYGYYVMPILHGERLIGRVAPRMDRRRKILQVESVHSEPAAPDDEASVRAMAGELRRLAQFAGTERVVLDGPVPQAWRPVLESELSLPLPTSLA